ncbi:hypothetical protein BU17DRAFT_104312 [Hysterangium stoloniferum]|nr:hypothetical protein BU17DRAFT_104312 [Hysterangium stoloniferum]
MSSHIHPSSFHVTRLLWSGLVRFRTWHSRFHHRLAVWTSTNPIQQGNLLASVHAPNRILPTTGSPRFSEFDARLTKFNLRRQLFAASDKVVVRPAALWWTLVTSRCQGHLAILASHGTPYRSSPLQERHHIVIEDAVVDTITKPETYRPTPSLPAPPISPACLSRYSHRPSLAHLSLSLSPSSGILACHGTPVSPISTPRQTPRCDRGRGGGRTSALPHPPASPPAPPHISLISPSSSILASHGTPYRPSPLQERHHVVIEDAAVDAPMPYRTPCLSLSLSPLPAFSPVSVLVSSIHLHPAAPPRQRVPVYTAINPAKPRCRTARTAYIPAPRLAAHKRAGGAAMRCLSPSWCVFSASTKSG